MRGGWGNRSPEQWEHTDQLQKALAVLPYKRLMRMCHWIGSHFHDWIDYNGVALSIEVLESGRTFSDFWGKIVLYIYGQQTYKNVCIVGVSKVFFIQYKVDT